MHTGDTLHDLKDSDMNRHPERSDSDEILDIVESDDDNPRKRVPSPIRSEDVNESGDGEKT